MRVDIAQIPLRFGGGDLQRFGQLVTLIEGIAHGGAILRLPD
jgi:hypothetical protein